LFRSEVKDEVTPALKKMESKIPKETINAINRSTLLLQSHIKSKYLSGPRPAKLGVVTGTLRGSVLVSPAKRMLGEIVGKVFTVLRYALIHEKGGMAGKRRKVRIPARPYFAPALEDNRNKIMDFFRGAVKIILRP